MKIISRAENVRVLAKTSEKSRDGQSTYYKLAVLQGAECGTVSCSEEAFNMVENDKVYDFATTFNDAYKSYKIDKVVKMPAVAK